MDSIPRPSGFSIVPPYLTVVLQLFRCVCSGFVIYWKDEVVSVLKQLCTLPCRHMGEWRYSSTVLDLDTRCGAPGTRCIGGWVGTRACLDAMKNI
jgi:hypothetical protein